MTDAHDAYLQAQVLTATPQRLRLMLIDGAIRFLRQACDAWREGRDNEGRMAVGRCREIEAELIGAIRPGSEVADRVLAIHGFLYRSLALVRGPEDLKQLEQLLPVLEEERTTWQAVCEQLPAAVADDSAGPEEVRADGSAIPAPDFGRTNRSSLDAHSTGGSGGSWQA